LGATDTPLQRCRVVLHNTVHTAPLGFATDSMAETKKRQKTTTKTTHTITIRQ